jgi:hypothetical protein
MKTYERTEIPLQEFLTSTIDGGGVLHALTALTLAKETRYTLNRRLSETKSRSWRYGREKCSSSSGKRTPILSASSRVTTLTELSWASQHIRMRFKNI